MTEESGFFVKFGDCFYSEPYDRLSEARIEAKRKCPGEKLPIYHGNLKRINDQIFDDSELTLVPRIGGYVQ
jgi:hypothetical protein